MRTNQNVSLLTNVLQRTANPNQKSSSSTNVIRRKTNHNALLINKKIQTMRLHITCRDILTYSNVEEIFWTELACNMKERA